MAGLICDINNGRVWHRESINYPIRNGISVLAQKRTLYPKLCCKKCSQTISKKSKQGLCSNCYNEKRSEHIPDKNTLHNLLFNNSFIEVGKMYGVSDNAVRKWCDKYNIPRHASYYRNVA
ncbi:MAG: hypothetical protein II304_08660 [Bacteroidales bacterium]|nr:hypothetical protein [Bacteroidales bacterium]